MCNEMKEKYLIRIMYSLVFIGFLIAAIGLSLAIFTDKVSAGNVDDIMQISLLIAIGLLISIPAKIYLTFQLMKANSKK
jgi:uncharacterized membrane protein